MRNKLFKKMLIVISIIIIGLALNGCGQVSTQTSDTGKSYQVTTTKEAEPQFNFQIENILDSNTYKIRFAATNISSSAITITFTKSPCSYYYTISNVNNETINEYQAGLLDVMESVTIQPGESYISPGFTYTKQNNEQLTINNKFSFIQDNSFNNKSITRTF